MQLQPCRSHCLCIKYRAKTRRIDRLTFGGAMWSLRAGDPARIGGQRRSTRLTVNSRHAPSPPLPAPRSEDLGAYPAIPPSVCKNGRASSSPLARLSSELTLPSETRQLPAPAASLQQATPRDDYSSVPRHKLSRKNGTYSNNVFNSCIWKRLKTYLVNAVLMVFVLCTIWGCCHYRWLLKKQCFPSCLPPFNTKATNDLDS